MARAAVVAATNTGDTGTLKNERQEIRLKNVVWGQPIMVEERPTTVHIRLFPEENATCQSGEIVYEIYSSTPGGDASEAVNGEPVVHCQGSAVLNSITEIPPLDLNALVARCNQNTVPDGPDDPVIEKLYSGPDQVVAKLSLPASLLDTKDQYLLHPVDSEGGVTGIASIDTGT